MGETSSTFTLLSDNVHGLFPLAAKDDPRDRMPPELASWRERDFVLYRSGAGTRLSVEEAGEATEFVGRQRALSDHAALRVRFRTEALAP